MSQASNSGRFGRQLDLFVHVTSVDTVNTDFFRYLIESGLEPGERLPALPDLGVQLGVSVGKLREQLEVARHLGLVSVRPRLGTQREPFDFHRAVVSSVLFSLASGEAAFEQFSKLRQTLEANMWCDAVSLLTDEDEVNLRQIITRAWGKLKGDPVHIPNGEHRELHLQFFSRLDNPFVRGLLEAYWDAYEATELTRLAEYQYWLEVWDFHERIVEALCRGEHELSRRLLVEHFALLPTLGIST